MAKKRTFIGPLPQKHKTAAQVARQRRRNERRRAKAKAFIGPRTEIQSKRRGKKVRIKGKGDYKIFGVPIKSKYNSLREALGSRFSKASDALFGEGDYKSNVSYTAGNTMSNSIIHSGHNGAPAVFASRVQAKGSFPMKYRDFVAQVNASNGLVSIATYILQAANATLFTFMSRMANLFEEWDPHGIVFFYESTSSFAPGTIGLGDIVMYFQYRPEENALTSVVQALTYADSCAGNPTENMLFGVECKKKERPYPILYVSDGTTQPNQDIFDFGKFSLLVNVPGAISNAIGRLWITYDIDFYKPVPLSIWPSLSASYPVFHQNYSSGITSSVPFGVIVPKTQTLPGVTNTATNGVIQISNPGYYFILDMCNALTGTVAAPTITVGANAIGYSILNGGLNSESVFNTTNTIIGSLFNVTVAGTGVGNNFTFARPTSITAGGGDTFVFPIPAAFALRVKNLNKEQSESLLEQMIQRLTLLESKSQMLIEEIKEENIVNKTDDSDTDAVYLSTDEAILNGKLIQLNPLDGFQSLKKRRGRK